MILLALCCIVAAAFAWFVIPKKPMPGNPSQPVPPMIPGGGMVPGPEAAKMAEKLVVLQQFADQKQKEKQVETVVKEFQELLK